MGEAQAPVRVLFIGNSYTYFNDMPAIFASICAENGVEADIESVTWGDYTFARFLDPSDELGALVAEKLGGERYDYVVMQEYSHVPATDPGTFFRDAAALAAKVRANGATPVLYETWARADGDHILVENGWTHEEEQDLLRSAYEKAAADSGAILVYAGDRFSEAYRAGEGVFEDDGSHPTELGSRLVAKVFYETLFE